MRSNTNEGDKKMEEEEEEKVILEPFMSVCVCAR